jgi:acyl-CoA reductase-like NAD-dependent aldehyde dehydrogenase
MKIEVTNPRTGAVDHWIVPPTATELDQTASRLREAQVEWASQSVDERVAALGAWHAALAARRDELVAVLTNDTGRHHESVMEVDAVLGSVQRWAAQAPALLAEQEPRRAAIPMIAVHQGLRPYPLVGVISPWNFPFLLSVIDAIPALAAGCAVLIKPSEITPRFVEVVEQSLRDVPALDGVLSYVVGDGTTGAAVVDLVDLVCFTGSVATGERVAARAADRLIPAFLELGGKDAAIVLASADLDRASSAILWGGTANAGQSCQSIERVYVEASVVDDFVDQLVAKARAVTLAVPGPTDGHLGPIIAPRQVGIIQSHLDDAIAKGAQVQCGGVIETHDGGAYLRPTVLTGVTHDMLVMTEETFGPILPVMVVPDVDTAVALANATVFGLSGAVFGDQAAALDIARRLDAGGISINDAALTALVHDGEKHSFGRSGLGGSRMGPAALRRFGRRQAYLVNDSDAPDPWWYR